MNCIELIQKLEKDYLQCMREIKDTRSLGGRVPLDEQNQRIASIVESLDGFDPAGDEVVQLMKDLAGDMGENYREDDAQHSYRGIIYNLTDYPNRAQAILDKLPKEV